MKVLKNFKNIFFILIAIALYKSYFKKIKINIDF